MIEQDQLGINGLQTVFVEVAQSCRTLKIDFFVVGAVSKNVWLAENQKEFSGTKDIDFAVYVTSAEQYTSLKKRLIKEYEYQPLSDNAFRLISKTGNEIDLLPFGEIEKDGTVQMEGTGLVDIHLAGFQEVYELGQRTIDIDENQYMACSIPAMVILKLIAFSDRPERRIKDIKDIASIVNNYSEIETELIWREHNDLYGGVIKHDEIGLIVLGREMKKIVLSNKSLHLRLISILENATSGESNIPELMITNVLQETIEMQVNKLKLILMDLH